MAAPPALQDIIEYCYRAFGKVARPTSMAFSPYESPDVAERALSRPCRELSDDDIGPYAGSAVLTVGGNEDYRYFLPRILELSVSNPTWLGTEPPIIADRLERAEWKRWSSEHQAAVRRFFDGAYGWSIDAPDELVADAALWLCGNLMLDADPSNLCERWSSNGSPMAAYRLAELRCSVVNSRGRIKRPPFWDDIAADRWDAMTQWLLSPAVSRPVAKALPNFDEDERWRLQAALDLVAGDP